MTSKTKKVIAFNLIIIILGILIGLSIYGYKDFKEKRKKQINQEHLKTKIKKKKKKKKKNRMKKII